MNSGASSMIRVLLSAPLCLHIRLSSRFTCWPEIWIVPSAEWAVQAPAVSKTLACPLRAGRSAANATRRGGEFGRFYTPDAIQTILERFSGGVVREAPKHPAEG